MRSDLWKNHPEIRKQSAQSSGLAADERAVRFEGLVFPESEAVGSAQIPGATEKIRLS